MVNMKKIEAKIREMFTKLSEESGAVEYLEQLIETENENAEVIGTLIDRIEDLESKVQSLNDRLKNEDRS
jgi:hypothetical protein